MPAAPRKIRLATRKSRLALVQAREAAAALEALGVEVELVEITTGGDRDRRPLQATALRGAFTKALEDALLEARADAAVHSAKDLPTALPAGLALAAALPRADPRDCLVSRRGHTLDELPPGALVGTSSPRRAAAVLARRPDLEVRPIRGNVPTRLEKVRRGDYDAAVLAHAGLIRLGLEKSVSELLEPDIIVPAAGQGAIVLEAPERSGTAGRRTGGCAAGTLRESASPGGATVAALLEKISGRATLAAITAERSLLRALGAGCRTPVGALAAPHERGFLLRAAVWLPDGSRRWDGERAFEAGGDENVSPGRPAERRGSGPKSEGGGGLPGEEKGNRATRQAGAEGGRTSGADEPRGPEAGELAAALASAEEAGRALAAELLARGAGEALARGSQ